MPLFVMFLELYILLYKLPCYASLVQNKSDTMYVYEAFVITEQVMVLWKC